MKNREGDFYRRFEEESKNLNIDEIIANTEQSKKKERKLDEQFFAQQKSVVGNVGKISET